MKNNIEVILEDTINSGQVFLWKKFNSKWYGINGKKLLVLEHMMNTKAGKIEAKKRTKILKNYLSILKKEISQP